MEERTAEMVQEWYETGSRECRARARMLRKQGYRVVVQNMGDQITSVGRIRCTMLTIFADAELGPVLAADRDLMATLPRR